MADAGLPDLQVEERDRRCGQVGLTRLFTPGPLQACQRGHSQHLEHLLFYGAEPGAQNASGNTALHICALYNKVCSPPGSSLPAPWCHPPPLLFHYFIHLFICSLIHSFKTCFLSSFPGSGSEPGAEGTVVSKTDNLPSRDTPCQCDPKCSEGGHRESRSPWGRTSGLGLSAGSMEVSLRRVCHQS